MLVLKKIAVTGTVASGKSSVLKYFYEYGAYIVNSDQIVHELLVPETVLGKQIINLLGPEIVEKGQLSRKKIANKVFKTSGKLQTLEAIIHPHVLSKIEDLHKEVEKQQKHSLFLVEIPLLFEIGAESFFDYTITVTANEKISQKRFGKEDYKERMSRQFSSKKKASRADFVLENNGSLEELKKKTKELYQLLIKKFLLE